MSARQKPAVPTYRSGWCGTAQHDRCRGTYAGADCRCGCHTQVPMDLPPPLEDVCPTCLRPLPAGGA